MLRSLLRVKISGATVTETKLYYEGSITIDEEIMGKGGILPGEELLVVNINNGARFITYCIKGEKDSGVICINGPAARLAEKGDKLLILCFSYFSEEEAKRHKSRIIFLNEKNRITKIV
ncbi:MAG TPA: aspartate 1-decarboxylase [Candidatus Omnitrophica bacterium]|nr:aspartate 1-decarboxylase [Candidatus Omnitrophota bacterium]